MCIVESWLSGDISDSEVSISDYVLLRSDRNRHGVGVALYISTLLSFSLIPCLLSVLLFLFSPFGPKVALSVLYRSPSTSPYIFLYSLSSVLDDLSVPLYSHFVMFGDFNINVCSPSSLLTRFCNLINCHALSFLSTDFTRVTSLSASTIDLMLSSSPAMVKSCSTIPPLGSSDPGQ